MAKHVTGWRRVRRWTWRLLLGALTFVSALIGVVVILIHTDYGRELARKRIETQLQSMFSGGATIGKLEGSPFGTLVFRDVTINLPDGRRAVTVSTLRFGVDLLPLLSRRARLTDVVVDDANILLERDERGGLAIARMMPVLDWRIDVPSVHVHRAHIALDTGAERLDFDGVEVSGSLRSPQGAPIDAAAVVSGSVRQRGVTFDVEAAVRSSDEALEISSAKARLGGVVVTARAVRMTPASATRIATYAGTVTLTAPRAAVAKLVPGLELPVDVTASIDVASDEAGTHVVVDGTADGQAVVAAFDVDVAAMRARGWLATGKLDVTARTGGRVRGAASAIAVFDVVAAVPIQQWPTGTVSMQVAADLEDAPRTSIAIDVTSHVPGVVATVVNADGPGMSASATAMVRQAGRTITLDTATLTARSRGAVAGSAAISGSVNVDLRASGEIAPCLDLAVTGTVGGERIRASGASIASMRLSIAARGLPRHPRGHAELKASGIARGTFQLDKLELAAADGAGGKLTVSLRARPKQATWLVDADALVTVADAITVELQRHRVRARGVEWTGSTGRLAIGRERIELRDFVTARTGGRDRISVRGVVVPPKELTDVTAWRRLDRDALRAGRITLEHVDLGRAAELAGVAGAYAGRLDADLRISPSGIAGHVSVLDVLAPALRGQGLIQAKVELSQPSRGELQSIVTARFGTVGGIDAHANIVTPRHIFDPAAWTPRAIKSAFLRVGEIELEPGVLDQLGSIADPGQGSLARRISGARGGVTLVAGVGEGARSATLALTVRRLVGTPIMQPVDAELTATIDDKAIAATLLVRSEHAVLVEAAGTAGVTLAELIANPRKLLTAPLDVTATVPTAPASQLLSVFGRSEVSGGTIAGEITIAGTVRRPTLRAHVVAAGLQLPQSRRSRAQDPARQLTIDVTWDGIAGSLVIDGTQDAGSLHLVAKGSPWALRDATATLEARTYDLSPLLVLVPGPVGGAAGQLDGNLSIAGLDPRTARLSGHMHLSRGRLPIAPSIGTLQRTTVDLVARDRDVLVTVAGELGGGTVKANGTIAIAGTSPTAADMTIELRKVSPIGVLEPIIDADVSATLRFADKAWVADVAITNARVTVPTEVRDSLKPVGAPADMRFANGEHVIARTMTRAPPAQPLLVANVVLHPTRVESDDLRSIVSGRLTVTTDGSSIGIIGTIDADRGDLDLFGRRYRVDRATVSFDGSTDPLIDVRITHDFSDVTTITVVHGRLSKPELVMSSDPSTYSQGQLLGFLIGGEPHGDPTTGSLKDSASGAGSSLVAGKVATYLRKALPIDLDVLRYESATSTSSGSFTIGSWVTRRLFLGYRSRPAARQDENFGEAQVEYWLSRRVILEAAGGDRGYSGVDLLWRKRY